MNDNVNNDSSRLVQFRYALGDNGQLIDALNLTDASKGENIFKCAGCGEKCHAALRRQRNRNHFRHLSSKAGLCSKETYLHRTAKILFYEEYSNCLKEKKPFIIEIQKQLFCGKGIGTQRYICDKVKRYSKYDLTEYYDIVNEPEKRSVDKYTPDIVLERSRGKELFGIEIYHSHKVGPEKRGHGLKFIEIRIRTESDLNIIRSHQLRQGEENISMYNIKVESEEFKGNSDAAVNECSSCKRRSGLRSYNNKGFVTVCPAFDQCDDRRCASCQAAMSVIESHGKTFVPKALKSYYQRSAMRSSGKPGRTK